MPLVRFVGRDTGAGIQLDGRSYFPGDVADLSPMWAAVMVRSGKALPVEVSEERVAVPEVEHRDTFGKKRKR